MGKDIETESSVSTLSDGAALYGILDLGYVDEASAGQVTSALLKGGADIIQLRAKGKDLVMIERVARIALPLCRAVKIPFILNDYPLLAAAMDADGVHIGQDDGPLADAREIMGPGKIVGRSTHSLEQARAALQEGFDYIGFGPLFPTPTKEGRPAIGLQEVAVMESEVGSKIPAFCIGGITPATLPGVLAAGARRAVVVSAILRAADITAATRRIRAMITSARS